MQLGAHSAGNSRQKLPLVSMAIVVFVCALHAARADDVGTVMPWDPAPDRYISTPNYVDTPEYTNYHAHPTFPGDRLGDNGLGNVPGIYDPFFGFPYLGAGVNVDLQSLLEDDHPNLRPSRHSFPHVPGGHRPGRIRGRFHPR